MTLTAIIDIKQLKNMQMHTTQHILSSKLADNQMQTVYPKKIDIINLYSHKLIYLKQVKTLG